jgi:hypothetical protein
MPGDRVKGWKRLNLAIALFLGLLVSLFMELRTPWSRFLELEAFRYSRQKEFPSRDLSYQSTSKTPLWEDTANSSSYKNELNSLIEATSKQRLELRLKYHSMYGLLPFAGTMIIVWLFGAVALWIYRGFKRNI